MPDRAAGRGRLASLPACGYSCPHFHSPRNSAQGKAAVTAAAPRTQRSDHGQKEDFPAARARQAPAPRPQAAAAAQQPSPQQQAAPPQQAKTALSPELNSALLKLQEAVVKEPGKAENWIKLGNFQFDNQNPAAAVTAYENALRLQPGNANVLTDLGIMYRELHRFDDALKAFREAERVQPGHRNALFNQGIVLYYDLKRKDEAEAAWRRLLAADPNAHAPDGTPVSELIKHLH